MDQSSLNFAQISKNLDIQEKQVTAAVKLLEAGNTIHFITRYRKDETGGLGESKLRSIQNEVARLSALNERKASILKSLENQGKLTADLKSQIEQANQSRKLEDIYLPFKPKKTSLAETARQQGLEPLARDILEGHNPEIDLASRATDFVRVDKGLTSVDEVIKGVQYILAERFSEQLKLRKQLRKMFWEQGEVHTELLPMPEPKTEPAKTEPAKAEPAKDQAATEAAKIEKAESVTPEASAEKSQPSSPVVAESESLAVEDANQEAPSEPTSSDAAEATDASVEQPEAPSAAVETSTETDAAAPGETNVAENATDSSASTESPASEAPQKKKKRKKKKKKKAAPDPFAEFKEFKSPISKMAPHRTLAINRGEKQNRIRSSFHIDPAVLSDTAREQLVPKEHPFAAFLNTVCDESMQRLILPGIEREIRRELTDRAETHAVNVFAKNLKHLFLQPPVLGKRILGIDPGYRSGCKMAVIDEMGQPVAHGVFSIVGNKERIDSNKQRLVDMINQHLPQLIAIGNGSGCRVVEQFVSDVFADQLKGQDLRYSIVNQAGTSSYSTSEVGQKDLPDHDPVIRSAISIARRLQDPLSELVKVNPANIGVGMYQHDIKGKHLSDSLDQVVDYCVNFVGVNANTASTPLLKHVSGVGEVTARKLVEHRQGNGSFSNRDELKQVSGFGDVTFVQAAGFLRIEEGENPLDATSIHPEDYEVAQKILDKLDCKLSDLVIPRHRPTPTTPPPAPSAATPADEATAEPPNSECETPAGEAKPDETASEQTAAPAEAAAPENTTVETAEVTAVAEPVLSPAEFVERKERRNELVQAIKALDPTALANELGIGEMKVRDLLRAIRNPLQDPRSEMPAPVFRKGILKFEDLKQDMQLRGQIVNVVDFGVFLNIGIGESCLVHISRLANRFVRDPHWLYAVGDVLNVWVQEVDKEKRRVTLTAIRPESAKREPRKRRSERSESGGRQRQGGGKRYGGKGRPTHARKGKTYEKRSSRKPKPVTPISQEMVEGKKPMRSFSDLLQFHQKKKEGSDDSDS